MKIGELAKHAGLTVRTLHHFDSIGLLSPQAQALAGTWNGHLGGDEMHLKRSDRHPTDERYAIRFAFTTLKTIAFRGKVCSAKMTARHGSNCRR